MLCDAGVICTTIMNYDAYVVLFAYPIQFNLENYDTVSTIRPFKLYCNLTDLRNAIRKMLHKFKISCHRHLKSWILPPPSPLVPCFSWRKCMNGNSHHIKCIGTSIYRTSIASQVSVVHSKLHEKHTILHFVALNYSYAMPCHWWKSESLCNFPSEH